jgi:hypothetical protein
MGAPVSKIEAAEETTAEELLSALKHIEPGERRKHATMYNYWLAIRRGGQLPPIRDLDPLEITDAAPLGVLLELVDGGEDAEILHVGETLRSHVAVKKLSEAPDPSVLSCIAGKLGIVSISRNALAFEDHFLAVDGTTRCSITLLPFSMSGDTVDFVYCLVSVETGVTFSEEETVAVVEETAALEAVPEEAEAPVEAVAEEPEPVAEAEPETAQEPEPIADGPLVEAATNTPDDMELPKFLTDPEPTAGSDAKPGFSKIFDALAGAKGFFGTVAPSEPDVPPTNDSDESEFAIEEPEAFTQEAEEPVAEEPAGVPEALAEQPVADAPAAVHEEVEEPAAPEPEHVQEPRSMEGTLQTKLTEVRSKADEARAARLRSEALIVEGLSAAYDFALDAEDAPEEYLRLVEGQGLKIQLRSPMKPVVKLAFDGYVDEDTIKQLETVLAWALKSDLPRGTLAERIEAEGGISAIANGQKARRATDA